jgi:DNA topoisomerase-1
MHHVVVVESPAKAKTINKYLGNDYTVLASFGHVRDLPSKDGSVRPDEDFAMTYEVDADSKKQVSAIAKAVKGANTLYLATDPDREGEAISWHVLEALKESNALPKGINVKRIVFHEITKKAVTHAVANPRDLDMNLINAQQARRALDYLVGFSLSPILWRKLPGSRSAGRVQSVALRLLCEREAEIEVFVPQEYWDISVALNTAKNETVTARLTEFEGEKLEKFSINNEARAKAVEAALQSKKFAVREVTPKQSRRFPPAPFATSTLQMDASRKLGFSAKKIMQLAQKLYEGIDIGGETVGLITYMRTDALTVSQDAILEARAMIEKEYGKTFLPDAPRQFKTKAKNAQEAHEAIRPTDVTRRPEHVRSALDNDMWRLYDLIWKRMVASQMEAAVYDQVAVDIEAHDGKALLRANGSVLKFAGFLTLYQEGRDEGDEDEETGQRLPELAPAEKLDTKTIDPAQHFTQAPPRYSEATLVKRLEELGIGRPSTYASIISVLIERGYAKLDKRRFVAESLGRLVTAFLVNFFDRYVEYGFTAALEDNLDGIANGEKNWKAELRAFWDEFSKRIEESKSLKITDVLNAVEQVLAPYIFGTGEAAEKARVCPNCNKGSLSLKTGKFGAFLGCSNYPECNFTRPLIVANQEGGDDSSAQAVGDFPRLLGNDPATGEPINLKKGPYGVYVQLGEGAKPKRAGLPKGVSADGFTLEQALSLLALPRDVGTHPESGKMIKAGIGRFGPYLVHDGMYANLPAGEDVLTVGMNRAVTLLAEAAARKAAGGGRKFGAKKAAPKKEAPTKKAAKAKAKPEKAKAAKSTKAPAKKAAKPTKKKAG